MTPDSTSRPDADPSAGRRRAAGDGAQGAGDPDRNSQWERFEATLERVARSPSRAVGGAAATVLLAGESGAGKTRAARRLHELSARADGPFVGVHLGGLAESLLEAELFGHVEGAYTGAAGPREGRFQRASGGTLVLEAVETLSLALQVKLLRVLQERVVEPLGAEAPVPVDCAIVATTSVDLAAAVAAGRFRQDLYFRLAVVPLEVPPLRTRTDGPGFAALCEELLGGVAARCRVPRRPLSGAALERLAAHPWPGNVRELENALERVLVLPAPGAEGDPVGPSEFGFLGEGLRGAAAELAREALATGVSLEELERSMIEEALAETRGNASAAARRLGLSRRAFDYRRKKLFP